ncbi:MAG: 3D domain-containing protein [Thermodesulfobacteriota bacterium]
MKLESSRKVAAVAAALTILGGAATAHAAGKDDGWYEATAYVIEGETASGTEAKEGIVAADPDVLPLGSRIRLHDAGPYAGEYVVKDKGRKLQGRELDVFVESERQAKEFGERRVRVEVLEYGEGREDARQEPVAEPEKRAPAVR